MLGQDTTTLQVLGIYEHNVSEDKFQEYAGFGTLTYHFTDQLDVQFGARQSFTREKQLPGSISGPYAALFLGGSPSISPQVENNGNAFTYLFTPQYKFTTDAMVYARFASGYRPGTGNGNVMGVPPKSNPDKTLNYELGFKGDWLNGALSVDTSVYYIDWKDIQINLYSAQSLLYTANGSEAKSEGVELALTARPTGSLSLTGWVDYDNAVLTKAFPASSPSYGASGDAFPTHHTSREMFLRSRRFRSGPGQRSPGGHGILCWQPRERVYRVGRTAEFPIVHTRGPARLSEL